VIGTRDLRPPAVPWRYSDFIRVYATTLVGAVGLLVAWYGSSGSTRLSTQAGWTDLGIAAVLLSGVGNTLWLVSGRRALGARRRLVSLDAGELGPAPIVGVPGNPVDATDRTLVDDPQQRLVSAPTMTRYHRAACPMVAGKPVRAASRARHEAAGRRPCGICEP
jgi:hypothetical protein